MRRFAALACILLLAPGCFVLDELDKGEAIMDAHSPKRNKQEAAPPPSPAAKGKGEDGEGIVDRLQAWVSDRKTAAAVAKRPKADPDDVPVRCQTAGRTQFLRKSDCQLRGGRIL